MGLRTYLAACIFFVGLSNALAATTAADCDSELMEVARVASLGHTETPIAFASCKQLAGDSDTFAALNAIALLDDNGVTTYDVHIAILSKRSKRVVAHLLMRGNWASDAYKIDSAKIDSTNFPTAGRALTFGITESWSASSRVSFYNIDVLTIFKKQGRKIVPVLSDLVTSIYQGDGCDVQTTRELKFERPANRTLAPVLTIIERAEGASRDNQTCEPVSDEIEKYTLKPVQGVYRVPSELRAFADRK